MRKNEFENMLTGVINGDEESFEKLILMYEPLINSSSLVKGKLDEDLKQHILIQIALNISKFRI